MAAASRLSYGWHVWPWFEQNIYVKNVGFFFFKKKCGFTLMLLQSFCTRATAFTVISRAATCYWVIIGCWSWRILARLAFARRFYK
jgi:hypothetical protein